MFCENMHTNQEDENHKALKEASRENKCDTLQKRCCHTLLCVAEVQYMTQSLQIND